MCAPGWMMAAAYVLAGACSAAMAAEQTSGEQRVSARLISEADALVPGETAQLAVTFEIAPEWHLYGPMQNETGGPPTFQFTAPQGFTLGEPVWPAPQRYLLDYGRVKILDHVYEDELTVVFPLEVSADAKPGLKATIAAKVDWVVCSTSCVFESDEVSLTLPVMAADGPDKPSPTPDAKRFVEARERHAKPLPKQHPPVKAMIKDDQVVFEAPGAAFLAFYPFDDSVPLENLVRTGEVEGQSLTVPLAKSPAQSDRKAGQTVGGILEVRSAPEGSARFWQIDETSFTLPPGE